MDERSVVSAYDGIGFSRKKQGQANVCPAADEPCGPHTG